MFTVASSSAGTGNVLSSVQLRATVIVFAVVFFLSPPLKLVTASSDEVRALLEFKKGIHKDPSQKVMSTWSYAAVPTADGPDLCPNSFHGVSCDGNSNVVVSLSLENLNLEGDLKFSTLLGLKSLRNLSLAGNYFTGRLVPQLGSMSSLVHLDLSDNRFIGGVPNRIHDLSNLNYLNLSKNRFTGWYPSGIRNMQQLKVLDIHGNELFGDVGVFFSELLNAEFVDLSCNNFSGGLPVAAANVPSLGRTVKHLNLSRNLLSGTFLSNELLLSFRILEVLDLGDNMISGELPSFEGVFNLKVLRVPNNGLYGEAPAVLFSSLVPVMELDLSGNGFSGSIRGVNSTTLEIFDLSSNRLTGSFPEFTSQTSLTTLRFSNNSMEGDLPSDWQLFPRLSKLDLSVNNFAGPIPPALFTLNLVDLNLSRNHFNGEIRLSESKMSLFVADPVIARSLENLDLSDNSLEGGLPEMIGYLKSLKLLKLAKNGLSGRLPHSLSEMDGLESLDLSNNRFEGPLPNKRPSSVKTLNVTYNNLSGELPVSWRGFPPSSFHPGNEKLSIPNISDGPDDLSDGGRPRSSKSNIRVAIILASIGAACMIAVVLVAYYRSQFHTFHGRSKFDESTTRRDVKFGGFTRPSLFKFYTGSEPPQSSMSFSNDLLLTSNSGSLSGQIDNVVTVVDCPPEVGRSSASHRNPNPPDIPVVTSDRKASGSPLSSPDRFAGELYFLDNSLSFSAEQLSRAPAEVLGRSSHGTMYKATLDGGIMLTVKWLRVGLVKHKKEFSKEVKKIGAMRHPNIVPVQAYYWGPREQEKLVLSDFVPGDSLALHLYESTPRRHSPLSFGHRLRVAVDVARCLVFLHDKGMPHGNLKPTNIILAGPNFTANLTDYCLNRLMTPTGIAEQILNLGALGYGAPELVNASKPTPTLKADVYALGVILMELLTRRSAGDIISGQSGSVDLTDWVRLCDHEGRRMDCIDRQIGGGEESSKAMDDMLGISLRCILPVSERPNIRQVFEDLCSISA